MSLHHFRIKKRGDTVWRQIPHADLVAVLEGFWSVRKLSRKHESHMSCGDVQCAFDCTACVCEKRSVFLYDGQNNDSWNETACPSIGQCLS